MRAYDQPGLSTAREAFRLGARLAMGIASPMVLDATKWAVDKSAERQNDNESRR
jgi:hypothetical protein